MYSMWRTFWYDSKSNNPQKNERVRDILLSIGAVAHCDKYSNRIFRGDISQ